MNKKLLLDSKKKPLIIAFFVALIMLFLLTFIPASADTYGLNSKGVYKKEAVYDDGGNLVEDEIIFDSADLYYLAGKIEAVRAKAQ